MRQPVVVGMLLAGCLSLAWRADAQDEAEDATLATMLAAGMTDSAQAYATAQRDLWSAEPQRVALWTMRLMETQAQSALRQSEERGAEQLWSACKQTAEAFLDEQSDNPRGPWIAWQASRCSLLRAQSELAKYLAAPANAAARERALEGVRTIVRETDTLVDDIRRRQPLAARQSVQNRTEAPADQLAELLVDVGLLQCEALLIRSRLYPAGSRDRTAAATDVAERAQSILAITSEEWESRPALQLAQAIAWLELSEAEQGVARLVTLARDGRASVAQRAAVVAIEYLAQQGELSRARALLALLARIQRNSPQYALAELRLQLAAVRGNPPNDREQQLGELVTRAREIGRRYGAYWQHRAEALLLDDGQDAGSSESGGMGIELMLVEVRQLLAAGEEQAALQKLLGFRDTELAAGRGTRALKLATHAYALLRRSEQWLSSADALAAVTATMPGDPAAAEAHQRAIRSLSQALRSNPQDAALRDRYEAALLRQLQDWPQSQHTDEVQRWLETWLVGTQRRKQYGEALLLRAAAQADPAAVRTTLDQWLESFLQLATAEQPQALQAYQAALEERSWETIALIAARTRLLVAECFANWPNKDIAQTQATQYRTLLGSTADPRDRAVLATARLLALVRSQALPTARDEFRDWNPSVLPNSLWLQQQPAFVEAIEYVDQQQPASWVSLLGLNSLAAELIAQKEPKLQACGYRIRIWQGDAAAVESLQRLAEEHPRDGTLYCMLASAWLASEPPRVEQALQLARRLVGSSPDGSELSFRARWLYVRALQVSAQPELARQQMQLLLATQPHLPELWRERFQSSLP